MIYKKCKYGKFFGPKCRGCHLSVRRKCRRYHHRYFQMKLNRAMKEKKYRIFSDFSYKSTVISHIMENACGYIQMADDSNGLDANFSMHNGQVTFLPFNDEARRVSHTHCYNTKSDHFNEKWFYGFSEYNSAIAIFANRPMRQEFSSGLDLCATRFYSPMYIQGSSSEIKSAEYFDCIEFYGGVVDEVYDPVMAYKTLSGERIEYADSERYVKKYDVEVEGESFKIFVGIYTDRSLTTYVPKIEGNTHSAVRFVFGDLHMTEELLKYRDYGLNLFQFCSGRLNVKCDIRLYNSELSDKPMYAKIADGYEDYSKPDSHRVISISHLSNCFPKLFRSLNDGKKKPYLQFLPASNRDSLLYTQVNDLCIAMEKEYGFLTADSNEKLEKAAKTLAKMLLNTVTNAQDVPEEVKTKASNIIGSNLQGYSPSLREKMVFLYEKYKDEMRRLTEQDGHDDFGIVKFYSDEEFKRLIGKFKNIRNSASHYGVEWNEGYEIFDHLVLLVYYSIMDRSGYGIQERSGILSGLFFHRL